MRLPRVLASILVWQILQNDVDHAKQERIWNRFVAFNVEREHPLADLQLRCKRVDSSESDGGSRQQLASGLCVFQLSLQSPSVRPFPGRSNITNFAKKVSCS
jgi:hypothetical protein